MKRKTIVPWRGISSSLLSDTPLANVPDEVNRLFENLLSTKPLDKVTSLWSKDEGGFMPSVDVEEGDKEIVVRAELAGMKEDDVEILLDKDVLTLRGEKRTERREDGYYESRVGHFERVVPLGMEVVADQVQAAMTDGVLTVRLPKTNVVKENSRKISIKSSSGQPKV